MCVCLYIYIYIYIEIIGRRIVLKFFLGELVIFFIYGTTVRCVCVYIYIRIFTISYTLIAVNISFFHRLMSFEVQSCDNLNGTNQKEDRTQQEKKSFTDRKTLEAIVCK